MEQNFTITNTSAIYTITISRAPTPIPTKHDEAQMFINKTLTYVSHALHKNMPTYGLHVLRA
jgi:hypothetical protein